MERQAPGGGELETSAVTTRLIVHHVRERGGEAAVAELLRRADVPYTLEQLQDESRWISYAARVRLFEAAVDVLGDPDCPFAMGATALRSGLGHSIILVLRALGSPAQVYRQLPRAVPKFSTTSTMRVLDLGRTHATLSYRLHEGYAPSPLNCRYAQGLIRTVPEIFGLPPATLTHEQCESDGAEACIYHVRWAARARAPWRRSRRSDVLELEALRGQLEALQSAAADLVESEDLRVTLRNIVRRAASAVLAPRYLLAVDDPWGGDPLVESDGLTPDETADLAGRLLAGEPLGDEAVVVDVASSRRRHGRLAAVYPPGQRGLATEDALLGAYARHAAAALDLLMALEDSRRGEARSADLLRLAHRLRAATDEDTIAEVVAAALPDIVGSDSAAVLRWDPTGGTLTAAAAASAGLPAPARAALHAARLRWDDTPELVEMLTRRRPRVHTVAGASPVLRTLLTQLGLDEVIVVPLLAGRELLGVATASWSSDRAPRDSHEAVERLYGVGEYAATALQNARLLATVRHQALHDALTGLPNRVLFTRTLEQTLLDLADGEGAAVLFCDLDRFKRVNDTLGHPAGDELLRQVAARLSGVLRAGDTAGRLSGDEFAVLLRGARDPDAAEALARRVVACLQEPFRVAGRELRVTMSVGVALHTGVGGRADDLLREADDAMYAAKAQGRNQVAVGTSSGAPGGPGGPASLENELRHALTAEQLHLDFQPVWAVQPAGEGAVPSSSEPVRTHVVGAEALVRWRHPRLGPLSPAAFLPMAEETGLVVELDLWAVRAACAALARSAGESPATLHVAVNVSSSTLLDARLHETVRSALATHALRPEQVYLEVVESRALLDVPAVADRLTALRRLGVRIALDDFGTGYSTLSWLQRLPVDQVKIDQSFIAGLPDDAAANAVVRGVLALARELDVEVVAEGVETPTQLAALAAAGCPLVQGYLLGRPAPCLPVVPDGGRHGEPVTSRPA